MNSSAEPLRELVSRGQWQEAVAYLHSFSREKAADALLALAFEDQQKLFCHLPVQFAGELVAQFPYYHQYVLLQSRPRELRAVVDSMNPGDRLRLFDELPEEAWRQLMDQLAAEPPAPYHGEERRTPVAVVPPRPAPAPPEKGIVSARKVEKIFVQPDGHKIQVIAPTDLSIEAGAITALLGPSGSRQVDAFADSVRSGRSFLRGSALARQAAWRVHAESGYCVPEFRAVSLADGAGERGGAAAGAWRAPPRAAPARFARSGHGGTEGICHRISQGTFRRHEAARGICARAGRRARSALHGRTFLRARRADGGKPAR